MLHIIVRSYGGENKKERPQYYSKTLALASLIRSALELPHGSSELVFCNDGPMPADRPRLMERFGEVIARPDRGLKDSLLTALDLPRERGWAPDDLVWFAEDDYLYSPSAFPALVAAGAALPSASYFGLYALIGPRLPNGADHPETHRIPPQWAGSEPVLIDGHPWRKALSTTSTFGARVKAIADDRRMTRLAMRSGSDWDHTACLMYQGYQPYPLTSLIGALAERERYGGRLRRAGIFAGRMALGFYQALRSRRAGARKVLMAADPPLITHLETEHMAAGTDWAAVAHETHAWLNDAEVQV